MDKNLEERLHAFEQELKLEASISFSERISCFVESIKKKKLLTFYKYAIPTFAIGLGVWAYYSSITQNYAEAYKIVDSMRDTFIAATKSDSQVQLAPKVFYHIENYIKAGSEIAYSEEAKVTLEKVCELKNSYIDGASTKELSELSRDLWFDLFKLKQTSKRLISWIVMLGSFAWSTSVGMIVPLESLTDAWNYNTNYKEKLNNKINEYYEIKPKLLNNKNLDFILDDFEEFKNMNGYDKISFLNRIKKYGHPKYGTVIKSCVKNNQDTESLILALEGYAASYKDEIKSHKELKKYRSLYLKLLDKGWPVHYVIEGIFEMEKIDEPYTNELLLSDNKPEYILNVLNFWMAYDFIESDKKERIAEYLLTRQDLAKDLQSNSIRGYFLKQFLNNADDIPNVGIKGQVKLLAKINKLSENLSKMGDVDSLNQFEEIICYKGPKFTDETIKIINYMQQFDGVEVDEVLKDLSRFYKFSDNSKLNSKLIKKFNRDNISKKTIDKNTNKLIQEIERKTKIAEYKKIVNIADNLHLQPLERIIYCKPPEDFILTPQIINVIIGYNTVDYRSELKPIIREVLKEYVNNPDETREYIQNMDGNQKLLDHYGEPLIRFDQGLSKKYVIGVDENQLEKIKYQFYENIENLKNIADELKIEHNKIDTLEDAIDLYNQIVLSETNEENEYLLLEAKMHFSNIKQQHGYLNKEESEIIFYTSNDFIESMQMGVVSKSCTHITNGANKFASIVNTVDINKQIVYMADESGRLLGRTLAVLTDSGIVTYNFYDNTNLATSQPWLNYFEEFSQRVDTNLIIPKRFAKNGIVRHFNNKYTDRDVSAKLRKAVCSKWYDDLKSRVEIPDEGYKIGCSGFILK